MQLFGRCHGKALGEIKTHLVTKNRARAGAGAVGFVVTVVKNMTHEIEVLLHSLCLPIHNDSKILPLSQGADGLNYAPDKCCRSRCA